MCNSLHVTCFHKGLCTSVRFFTLVVFSYKFDRLSSMNIYNYLIIIPCCHHHRQRHNFASTHLSVEGACVCWFTVSYYTGRIRRSLKRIYKSRTFSNWYMPTVIMSVITRKSSHRRQSLGAPSGWHRTPHIHTKQRRQQFYNRLHISPVAHCAALNYSIKSLTHWFMYACVCVFVWNLVRGVILYRCAFAFWHVPEQLWWCLNTSFMHRARTNARSQQHQPPVHI